MAKLNGVYESVDGGFIEHGGIGFYASEDPVNLGDIVRCKSRRYGSVIHYGEYYQVTEEADGAVAFLDEEGDATEIGTRSSSVFDYLVNEQHFTVFRRVETPSTAVLIAQKRCELAALEAQLAEESTLKVGDYVLTSCGNIERITHVDSNDSSLPYHTNEVLSDSGGWRATSELERLTPAEARAALIAQVNALFDEDVS